MSNVDLETVHITNPTRFPQYAEAESLNMKQTNIVRIQSIFDCFKVSPNKNQT